jgi:hypothetical protein
LARSGPIKGPSKAGLTTSRKPGLQPGHRRQAKRQRVLNRSEIDLTENPLYTPPHTV